VASDGQSDVAGGIVDGVMSIAGNLETMPLADILQWLSSGCHTGTLAMRHAGIEKSLYFREGQIISCRSTDPREFLGHFLVSRGQISEQDLAHAMAQQDERPELLGKILVDRGAISQQDLESMLRLKAEESIYDLFRWQEGEFRFIDDQLPAHELVPISIDVAEVVFEGTRRSDEWRLIEQAIPSSAAVPVAVGDLLAGEQDESHRAVLKMVNDDRTIEEICLQTHSSEFFVSEILFRKVRDSLLKLVRPRVLEAAVEHPATTAAALLDQARERSKGGEPRQALRRLRAALSLEPGDPDISRQARDVESRLRAGIQDAGIDPAGVPVVTASPNELGSMVFSPEAGFILSRINGRSDLASILKITPLPELEALLVLQELVSAGLVRLEYR
jgi:hypothetical protein